MLKDEIDKLKENQIEDKIQVNSFVPQLDLNVPMLIPETYVKDLTSRLSLYRELALLKNDEELNEFSERLVDRFGSLPYEVEILLKVTSIKNMCISTGIDLLKIGYSRILIGFHENNFSNPKGMQIH